METSDKYLYDIMDRVCLRGKDLTGEFCNYVYDNYGPTKSGPYEPIPQIQSIGRERM